jgi:pyruvate/2-oxoacid:ferredoxin oxidoreductase alpha subunit
MHAKMNAKRFHKLAPLTRRRDLFHVDGDPDAPIRLVSWGSIAGVCREAYELREGRGAAREAARAILLYPVAEEIYRDFFLSVKRGLVVEASHQGQLYRILRMHARPAAGASSRSVGAARTPFSPRDRPRAAQLDDGLAATQGRVSAGPGVTGS